MRANLTGWEVNRFVCCVILLTYCQTHAHTDMFYLNEQTVYAVYRVPASPHSGYIVGEAHRSSLLEGGQHALARAKQWIQAGLRNCRNVSRETICPDIPT